MMLAHVTKWPSLTNTKGQPYIAGSWDKILDRLATWRPFDGEESHPGWSAAVFEPCERSNENVKAVTALVLDYDGTSSIQSASEVWRDSYGVIHTTRRHTADVHRFRVVLPLARPVSPFEYAAIWRRVYVKSGRLVDPAPKDAGRFWFLPGSSNQSFVAIRLDGKPLDPDALLAEPEPVQEPVKFEKASDAERRASAYLAKIPGAISGSGGHSQLWTAALAMVNGFGLDHQAAFRLLKHEYNPRCQPPWSDRELHHKIGDAETKSKVPHGYALDERRDFEPRSSPASEPKLAQSPPVETQPVKSVADLLDGVFRRAKSDTTQSGCPSGHGFIDGMIGGFRRGRVTVLGATTSWGKSSFAVMTANSTMRAGGRVLLVSGEDTEDTFGNRIMAARASVNAIALRDNRFSAADFDRMVAALNVAESWPFFMNAIGQPAEKVCEQIAKFCESEQPDLVIVDYLQAFGCERRCQDRRNEVTHIARTFVDTIKRGNSAGLIFSQLKRIPPDTLPTKHDLKESGDVENMAEHVLIGFLKKNETAEHDTHGFESFTRYVLIEKNKDGPVLSEPVELPFNILTACFEPITNAQYMRRGDK